MAPLESQRNFKKQKKKKAKGFAVICTQEEGPEVEKTFKQASMQPRWGPQT
jgi:hypothetical protein